VLAVEPSLVPEALRRRTLQLPALAAFDADGCLWQGDVAEDFTQWMIRRGAIPGTLWAEYEAVNAKDPITACYVLLRFYAGVAMDALTRAAEQFWSEGQRPWNAAVIDTLRWLKQQGCAVYVVSGSPSFVLAPLLRTLPVDRILAFELAVDGRGRATGAHRGVPTAGPGKAEAIRQNWRDGIAFAIGNSVLDTEMLGLADFAWAFEPSPALLREAQARGWHVTPRRT
jgi:HAD superfamily phosphoserine phosphatase-like hydrolase